jgi:hypothetical protein
MCVLFRPSVSNCADLNKCLFAFGSIFIRSGSVLTNVVSFVTETFWDIHRSVTCATCVQEWNVTCFYAVSLGEFQPKFFLSVSPYSATGDAWRWSWVLQPVDLFTVRLFVIRLVVCVYVFAYRPTRVHSHAYPQHHWLVTPKFCCICSVCCLVPSTFRFSLSALMVCYLLCLIFPSSAVKWDRMSGSHSMPNLIPARQVMCTYGVTLARSRSVCTSSTGLY